MSNAGRPRKPTAIKLVTGTAQPCRMNPDEPTPTLTDLRPPGILRLHGTARRLWRLLAPMLDGMSVLTDPDKMALGRLCTLWGQVIDWERQAEKDGPTYETFNKLGERIIRPNPLLALAADADRRAQALAAKFGLTPADRSRVKAQAKREADPFESFLNGTD